MLLLLPTALAQVDLFSAVASLEDGGIRHHVILRFSEPVQKLEWLLPYQVWDLKLNPDFQAECWIENGIKCQMQAEANKSIILDFWTSQDSWTTGEKKTVRLDYTFPFKIRKAIIFIKLPEQAVLAEVPANASFLPGDGKVMTDGKHIIVYWERDRLEAGEGMVFSVSYQAPVKGFDFFWLLFLLPIPALLAVFWLRKMRRQILTEVLLPEEKAVVELLEQNKGKLLQKQIAKQLDFSKAKVSRILKSLRKKGLVRIEPVSGRENRVLLRYEKRGKEEDSQGEG